MSSVEISFSNPKTLLGDSYSSKTNLQNSDFDEMTEELSGFPTLKPAIITKVNIGDVHDLGK